MHELHVLWGCECGDTHAVRLHQGLANCRNGQYTHEQRNVGARGGPGIGG